MLKKIDFCQFASILITLVDKTMQYVTVYKIQNNTVLNLYTIFSHILLFIKITEYDLNINNDHQLQA